LLPLHSSPNAAHTPKLQSFLNDRSFLFLYIDAIGSPAI